MRPRCWSLILAITGCGGAAETSDRLEVRVDSSGRYPVVRSTGPAPVWSATLVAAIGGADSGPGSLSSVRSVLLDRDGAVYVVDSRSRVVSRFDSLGRFDRQLGREGAGPAEYRSPYSVAWLGDTLALLDPSNARIGLFDRAGGWAGSWRSPVITGGGQVRLYRTPPDGFWAFSAVPRGGAGRLESVLVHYTSAGPGDTLDYLHAPPGVFQGAMCNLKDGGIAFFTAPFSPELLLVPTAGGERAVALTTEYRIAFLSPKGDTTRVIERPHQPVPISADEWNQGNAEFTEFRAKTPSATCVRTGFTRPGSKPTLKYLFLDAEGRLWVEVTAVDGSVYDVYDRAGGLVRTVRGLPGTGGTDPSARDDRVALVVRDSLDLAQVRVYRVTPPAPAPTP